MSTVSNGAAASSILSQCVQGRLPEVHPARPLDQEGAPHNHGLREPWGLRSAQPYWIKNIPSSRLAAQSVTTHDDVLEQARTAVRVRERGRSLDRPLVTGRSILRLAMSTTSLPLNFFSSSRTKRCWILWKAFSRRYGTCNRQ